MSKPCDRSDPSQDSRNPQDAAGAQSGSSSDEPAGDMPDMYEMPAVPGLHPGVCDAAGCFGCTPSRRKARGKTSFLSLADEDPETFPSAESLPVTMGSCTEHTMVKNRFSIRNICCESEVRLIERIVTPLPGVESVSVNSFQKICIVVHCSPCCTPPELILSKLNGAALGAALLGQGGKEVNPQPMEFREWCRRHARGAVVLCSALFLLASGIASERFASTFEVAAVLAGLPCILWESCMALKSFQLDVTFLVAVAVFAAASQGELFDAALVVLLFNLAKLIEGVALGRVASTLRAVIQLQAVHTVHLADGKAVQVSELQAGAVIALRPGDECPADGRVVAGAASCSEAALTGESRPVEKSKDSQVSSGTLILNGYIEVELSKPPSESHTSEIQARVEEAQTSRTARQMLIGRFAHIWTPAVILLALLTCTIPPLLVGNFAEWGRRAIVLLLTACPCAIVIGAPLATTCAIAAAAGHGVLIKRPDTVERLPWVAAAALDKTGTLTEGHMSVLEVEKLSGGSDAEWKEAEALKMAAALEMKSAHPIAAAIVSKALGCVAEAYGSQDLAVVKKFRNLPGVGIQGHLSSGSGSGTVKVLLGNEKTLDMVGAGAASRALFAKFKEAHPMDTTVALLIDGALHFGLALNDTLRPSAPRFVAELKELGLRPYILTGDTESSGMHVSSSVGVDAGMCFFTLSPEQKLDWVEQQQASGRKVLLVGDGINDATALAASSVGVAMGETGAALAAQSADIVLMTDKLHRLSQCIRLCKYAVRVERLNIGIPCAIKVVQGYFALFGELDLWMAVVFDFGTLLLVLVLGVSILSRRFWNDMDRSLPLSPADIGGKAVRGVRQGGYEEFV